MEDEDFNICHANVTSSCFCFFNSIVFIANIVIFDVVNIVIVGEDKLLPPEVRPAITLQTYSHNNPTAYYPHTR